MAKHYTEEFIIENLDGFGNKAEISLEDCLKSQKTIWQPVLQATIYSQINGKRHILTGTRKESTNPTHPNVVSTPTSLIPREYALALYQNYASLRENIQSIYFKELNVDDLQVLSTFPSSQKKLNIPNTSNSLSFIVANLLARKLGLSSDLEYATTSNYLAQCYLSMIAAGFCYAADTEPDRKGDTTPLFEPLLMFGVVVELESWEAIPEETDAYDNLSWSLIEDYQNGVTTKKIEFFNKKFRDPIYHSDDNRIKVCVRGLCLQTAKIIISNN